MGEPPGPAFGRPDDKLRDTHRVDDWTRIGGNFPVSSAASRAQTNNLFGAGQLFRHLQCATERDGENRLIDENDGLAKIERAPGCII